MMVIMMRQGSTARTADSSSRNAVSFFIRTHNETLSVAAMCVIHPDCFLAGIHG